MRILPFIARLISRRQIHTLAKQHINTGGHPRGGTVLIVTPGGIEQGGGIGRQMGYFLRACRPDADGLRYQIIDSRGPWFIGASPLCTLGAAIYLGSAVLALLRARCSPRPCMLHVNITGR